VGEALRYDLIGLRLRIRDYRRELFTRASFLIGLLIRESHKRGD
jgi:hypothetical protein